MEPSTPGRDERRLVRRWRTEGDVAAREELIARMLPLARSIARRYANRGEPLDDLEQVACAGSAEGRRRLRPRPRGALGQLRDSDDRGELKRHFRDRGWMMRVPRELQELHARVVSARGRLRDDLGRSPTVTELTAAVGADEEASSRRCVRPMPTARCRSTRRRATAVSRSRPRRWRPATTSGPRRERCCRRVARAARTGARDRAAAVLRGPDAARDRRRARPLADARLAAHPADRRRVARADRLRRGGLSAPRGSDSADETPFS